MLGVHSGSVWTAPPTGRFCARDETFMIRTNPHGQHLEKLGSQVSQEGLALQSIRHLVLSRAGKVGGNGAGSPPWALGRPLSRDCCVQPRELSATPVAVSPDLFARCADHAVPSMASWGDSMGLEHVPIPFLGALSATVPCLGEAFALGVAMHRARWRESWFWQP